MLSLLPVEWLLTDCAGVSEPAVSKHLGVLKSAGLVRDRPDGTEEETNYQGANYGWQKFIVGLERVAAGLD